MRFFFIPILIVLLINLSCKNDNIKIVKKIKGKIGQHNEFEYRIESKIKFFTSADTIEKNAFVRIQRDVNDTLKEYLFYIKESEKEYIYTDYNFYIIDKLKNCYDIVDKKNADIKDFFPWQLLFDPINKINYFTSFDSITINYNNSDQFIIIKGYKDTNSQISANYMHIYVDKKTYLPVKEEHWVEFNGMIQYISKEIKDLKELRFPQDSINQIINYHAWNKIPQVNKRLSLLENGIVAPSWELADNYKMEYKLDKLSYPLILLDFWYFSCYPCLMTIPDLNKLYEKYNKKGLVVLGLNYIDNTSKERRDYVMNYLNKNNITYPILWSDRIIDSSYNVSAYPTLYLLNNKKKIIYSHEGYNKDLVNKLDSIIKINL
ncbi:MAG TPA: TlpA disulfide reductase family protein [Bacteroidales bacterium]|nr:TlpA disulfide reductase family protein [Bacteroidales bacterium]